MKQTKTKHEGAHGKAHHRMIPNLVFSSTWYQDLKKKTKKPEKYEKIESAMIGGLHIFEWLLILLGGIVVISMIWHAMDSEARWIFGSGGGSARRR